MATKAKKNITTGETVIRIEGMHKWFGNFHALKDIDLEVFQGEKIVICGPSGSGMAAQHSLRLDADHTASRNIQSIMPGRKL